MRPSFVASLPLGANPLSTETSARALEILLAQSKRQRPVHLPSGWHEPPQSQGSHICGVRAGYTSIQLNNWKAHRWKGTPSGGSSLGCVHLDCEKGEMLLQKYDQLRLLRDTLQVSAQSSEPSLSTWAALDLNSLLEVFHRDLPQV